MDPEQIPLTAWADARGMDRGNARRLAAQNRLPGAVKLGRDWFVPTWAEIVPVPRGGAAHQRRAKPALTKDKTAPLSRP